MKIEEIKEQYIDPVSGKKYAWYKNRYKHNAKMFRMFPDGIPENIIKCDVCGKSLDIPKCCREVLCLQCRGDN